MHCCSQSQGIKDDTERISCWGASSCGYQFQILLLLFEHCFLKYSWGGPIAFLFKLFLSFVDTVFANYCETLWNIWFSLVTPEFTNYSWRFFLLMQHGEFHWFNRKEPSFSIRILLDKLILFKVILIGFEDNFQLIGNDKQLLRKNDWLS